MNIECRNPVYSDSDGTTIDVELNHKKYGWIPFTSSLSDTEELGRVIYERALAGEFGAVSDYVSDQGGRPSLEEKAEEMRSKRDSLIKESDWTQLHDSPLNGDEGWINYRQELRDVPQQQGFPEEIIWPTPPKI